MAKRKKVAKKTLSKCSVCVILHSLTYILDLVYNFTRQSKPGSTKTIEVTLQNVGGEVQVLLDEGHGKRILLDQ